MVAGIFDLLLGGKLSREDASAWARKLRLAEDSGSLTYEPLSDEPALWAAVQFLEGYDLLDAPDSYLHGVDDLLEFRRVYRI